MVLALCATLLMAPVSEGKELKSKIISASVFKSGLTMLIREVRVPVGEGRFKLDVLPDALDGSFWYGSPDGAKMSDVETTLRYIEKSFEREATTVGEILAENTGKKVTLILSRYQETPEQVTGTIQAVLSYGSPYLFLRTDEGKPRIVSVSSVLELDPTGLKMTVERKLPFPQQEIAFTAKADKPARIHFLTLEGGAAWQGSYFVSLDDPARATINGKAQLALGGLRFENTEVRLVTGAPSLPKTAKYDLAAGFGSLAAYLTNRQETYRAYRPAERDPYTRIVEVLREARQVMQPGQYAAYGGGGFGGRSPYGDTVAEEGPPESKFMPTGPAQEAAPVRVEDLFSYEFGKVSLAPGDRLTRTLIEAQAPAQTVYVWQIIEARREWSGQYSSINRVQSVVRLSNRTKLAWTGGPCLLVKENHPLAQVEMPFTPVGKDADIVIGEPLDIPTSRELREISRETIQVQRAQHAAVTIEATLTAENTRKDPLQFEIVYELPGEILDTGGGQVEALGFELNALNRRARIVWKFPLPPGAKKQVTFRYKTII